MDRNEVLCLARKAGFERNSLGMTYTSGALPQLLERFAALVAAQERETCAQLCDQMEKDAEGTDCCKWPTPADCAYAIRARSKEQGMSGDHNMHQKETPCLDNHEEKFQALWAEREKMWDEIVSLRGLLYQCLEAMENLHRTGDTQVFDLCVADTLLPVLRERLGVKKCN